MVSEAPDCVTLAPDDPRWRLAVAGHPDAIPFHEPGWIEAVAGCYGFRGFVLAVPDQGSGLAAGLPVVELCGPFGSRRWEALPFSDTCPPLVRRPGAEHVLSAGLLSAASAAGVERVAVRAPLPGLAPRRVAVEHVLDLTPGEAAVLAGFSSSARRGVRKARREGVTVRSATTEDELVRAFYSLHLQTRKRLGVPVQPRRFFRLLWRHVIEPGGGELLLARANGRPVAGMVLLRTGRTVVYKYGASDARALPLRPNNLLFAEAIAAAARAGYGRFDFGRSDDEDTGLRAFKAAWGAPETPLVYAGRGTVAAGRQGAARLLSGVIRRAPAVVCRGVGEALYRYAA
ncbi:MAG: GNAT family N-acetyltransferase [Actinomycetota bacterium]|nr:GNAT family N-acetyltransferase [Actinomycetota bacterium]